MTLKAEPILSVPNTALKILFFRLNPDKQYLKKKDLLRWLHLSEYHPAAQIGSLYVEWDAIKHCELNVKFNKKLSVS